MRCIGCRTVSAGSRLYSLDSEVASINQLMNHKRLFGTDSDWHKASKCP